MELVIVSILCQFWQTAADIWDDLAADIGVENGEKIWHVHPSDGNCILAVEDSIKDRVRQVTQGFKHIWPLPEDDTASSQIVDCLRDASVAAFRRSGTEIKQCFSSVALLYRFEDDLKRLLQHDQHQQIDLLCISVNCLREVIDRFSSSLSSPWVPSDFVKKIKSIESLLSDLTALYLEWEQKNPRLIEQGADLMNWTSLVRGTIVEVVSRHNQSSQPRPLRTPIFDLVETLVNLRVRQEEAEEKLKVRRWAHEVEMAALNPQEGIHETTDIEDRTQSDIGSDGMVIDEGSQSWAMVSSGEIPEEKTRLLYGCTAFSDCGKIFTDKTKWKRHESKHFQVESWKCDRCSGSFPSAGTFETHLNEHELSETTVQIKLHSCRISRNCQGNFWCGFCNKIENHGIRGIDASKKRLDHMQWHYEEEGKDVSKWTYPEKKWIIGQRDGYQVTRPTSETLNYLAAFIKKQDEELQATTLFLEC